MRSSAASRGSTADKSSRVPLRSHGLRPDGIGVGTLRGYLPTRRDCRSGSCFSSVTRPRGYLSSRPGSRANGATCLPVSLTSCTASHCFSRLSCSGTSLVRLQRAVGSTGM